MGCSVRSALLGQRLAHRGQHILHLAETIRGTTGLLLCTPSEFEAGIASAILAQHDSPQKGSGG